MTTQQTPPPWEDSIDLRKWTDALIRRWWLVVAITGAATLTAIIIGYGFQSPIYEATGGATLPVASSDNGLGLTPRGHQEFAVSTPVMNSVRERLDLEISAGQLRRRYSFQVDDDNFITVTATAGSAEQAYQLVDTWVEVYDQQVKKLLQQKLAQRKTALEQELGRLSQELASTEETLATFERENSVTTVESQLTALESLLSESRLRLQELRYGSLPDLESQLVALQDSLRDNIGAAAGGGAPTDALGSNVTGGLGALAPDDEIAASLERIEFNRDLIMARLSTVKDGLLESEDRLQELTLTSIPLAQARVASLEKAVAVAEAEARNGLSSAVSPDGEVTLDTVYLQLRQDLVDSRVELEMQQREAEILHNKIGILRSQMEDVRAELASLQPVAEDLEGQAATLQEIDQIERDLIAGRREVRRLETLIPGLEEQVKQMTVVAKGFQRTRRELQADVTRLSEEYNAVEGQIDGLPAIESSWTSISSLSTVREPALPEAPVSPQRVRNTALATFLGLLVGLTVAIFWDYYRAQPAAPPQNQE